MRRVRLDERAPLGRTEEGDPFLDQLVGHLPVNAEELGRDAVGEPVRR